MVMFNPYQPPSGRIGVTPYGQTNQFGQYLQGISNPSEAAAYGYGSGGETLDTKDFSFGQYLARMTPFMPPAMRRYLLANRGMVENDYQAYKGGSGEGATGPGATARFGDFLGTADYARKWRESTPFEANRNPYSFRTSFRSY